MPLMPLHAPEDGPIRLRQIGSADGRTLGDVSQVQQLLINLCLNAIQAMERNGELTVRMVDMSQSESRTLIVGGRGNRPWYPEGLISTVLEPFVTTEPRGTGLSLANCPGMADIHHAHLAVCKNSGRPGCTFTVEFPRPSAHPSRIAP